MSSIKHVALLSLIFISCGVNSIPPAFVITIYDDGKSFDSKVGDYFEAQLVQCIGCAPSSWVYSIVDTNVIVQSGKDEFQVPPDYHCCGGSGTHVIGFRSKNIGETKLELSLISDSTKYDSIFVTIKVAN